MRRVTGPLFVLFACLLTLTAWAKLPDFGNRVNAAAGTKSFIFITRNYGAYDSIESSVEIPTVSGYWAIGRKERKATLIFIPFYLMQKKKPSPAPPRRMKSSAHEEANGD